MRKNKEELLINYSEMNKRKGKIKVPSKTYGEVPIININNNNN